MIWRDTRITKPGYYLYREALPDAPVQIAHAFYVRQGMIEPRYGWGDPPPGSPLLLAKLHHEEMPVEADGLCGEFWCSPEGEMLDLIQLSERPQEQTPKKVVRKKRASRKTEGYIVDSDPGDEA